MSETNIQKVNKDLKTTNIKGKEYVEVNQRIKGFRQLYPEGSILTEIISLENGFVVMKATVLVNGEIIGTGHAFEKESSSYINKTSYIENCETSAVGRALGMCGIGIDTSVASAEEVALAIEQQNAEPPKKSTKKKDETAPAVLICENCKKPIPSHGKNPPSVIAQASLSRFGKQLCWDCGHALKEQGQKLEEAPLAIDDMTGLPFPIEE